MSRLTRITLRLARNPEAGIPEGDASQGYVVVAPLNRDGHLDVALWQSKRRACTVLRFTPDHQDDADGWLTHRGGVWRIHYDEADEGPDESLHRLADHRLFTGDYVTISDPDGEALVYRVSEAVEL